MLQYIRTFIAVYQTLSFTDAAEKLFISQPSVSTHIKNLEQELKTELFIRGKKAIVQATEEADLFYPRAQKILLEWQQTQDFFRNSAEQNSLIVGASHFSALTILPKIIPEFSKLSVRMTFEMRNSSDLISKVSQGLFDFAFVEQPVLDSSLSVVPVAMDKLVLAGNGDYWLLREPGASTYGHLKRYFTQNELPQKSITITNTDMIIALLKQGFGKTIISKKLIDGTIPYTNLDSTFQRPVNLIYREPKSEFQQIILNIVQSLKFS
ncbi:LysR family transcriptional regulator [Leuconostoc suionicum]|uniref:LysR family transcriptional regulator n=1 Tax=Leuconostoc suionicum TaxID=1511761 RepID=UPI0021AA14FB|nr:LysR family transcriptional regulator [Leuconostoc suionicum]MCT4383379.1 LysR family transcriptional regulator [Leuconostoc suionicum]